MSLLILGRAGETRVLANLGQEVCIRVVEINADRVLLDISTTKTRPGNDKNLPALRLLQAD